MGKVILTQEQADAIERLRKYWDDDVIIARSVKGRSFGQPYNACYRRLEEISIYELARAIDKGFKIEPQFKSGQWIYDITDENKTVIEVAYVTDRRVHGFWKTEHSDIDTHVAKENARHFTKEEIAAEKQRRWWAKHGRDVWEIREDDTLIYAGTPYIVDWFNSEVVRFKSDKSKAGFTETFDYVKEHFEVFCFAEDRKDVEHAK